VPGTGWPGAANEEHLLTGLKDPRIQRVRGRFDQPLGCTHDAKATKRFSIVIGADPCPTTKPGLPLRARSLAGVTAGIASLSLVTAITATVVVPPSPAAADQVSNLKAQATQIARDLVQEQLQVETYQQAYAYAAAKVRTDEAEIGSSEDKIQADAGRVSDDRKRLQDDAVSAYINSGADSDETPALFEGNQSEALARSQYEEVANGDITLDIDVLHSDENELQAVRATLEQQEAADQATTNREAALTNAADQTEAELESTQAEVTGQLALAVAQQQAAQAAAAAAAVRTAQATVKRTPTSTTQATSSAAPTAVQGSVTDASPGDPTLPPFLQCVLQAESSGNYAAVSPGGAYMGGFQFSQPTWNEAAQLAGMPQLVNVPPNQATPAQQDDLAIALYNADGEQPWNDRCRNG
jgi:peptidoglycan hydrolase CwlO-like protein